MEIPNDLRYAKSHEWVRDNGDGTATIGISDFAQDELGDVVFVELPEVGTELEAGGDFGVVESVKAASDIYSPVSGEVIEANTLLEDSPETINESPYEEGWLVKISIGDASEFANLLDVNGYQAIIDEG